MQQNSSKQGTLGLFTCVTMIMGGMIGSAIFSLSGMTIYTAGPAAILSWICAAILMLVYGLIIAELSGIFPESGGIFVFPSKALGKTERTGQFWGWISTWSYFNANVIAIAFSAIYIDIYLRVGFPALESLQVPLAVGSIAFCCLLCVLKIVLTGHANTALVAALVATLLTFVAISFFGGKWDTSFFQPFFVQGEGGATGFLSAIPVAMVAYGAIVTIAFLVGEVKNPKKNVPRSIFIAMALVVVLYVLVIMGIVGLVPTQDLIDYPAWRFIPLAVACFSKLAAFPWLIKVVSLSAALGLLTTVLIVMMVTARTIQAAASGGIVPHIFAKTAKSGAPVIAVVFVSGLSAIVSAFPQFTQDIVNFGALTSAVIIAIQCISLIAARRKFPYVEGAFRMPFGTVVAVITLIVLIICYIPSVLGGGFRIWGYTIAWYCIGCVIFVFRNRKSNRGR